MRLFQAKIFFLGLALVFLSETSDACVLAQAPLLYLIGNYRTFKAKNLEQLAALKSKEKECVERGAEISGSIASMAAGLSCQATLDASHVDKKMGELGEKCELVFKQIFDLQTQLLEKFKEVEEGLSWGIAYWSLNPPIDCPAELNRGKSMVSEFLDLERAIVGVRTESLDGKTNYGRFKDTARDLQKLTGAKSDSCGEAASMLTALVQSSGGMGSSRPPPKKEGTSKNSSSTVTGELKPNALSAGSTERLGDRSSVEVPAGSDQGSPLRTVGSQKKDADGSPMTVKADHATNSTRSSAPFGSALDIVADVWNESVQGNRNTTEVLHSMQGALSSPDGVPATPGAPSPDARYISSADSEMALGVDLRLAGGGGDPAADADAARSEDVALFQRITTVYRRKESFLRHTP